jgi:hypothetical protein
MRSHHSRSRRSAIGLAAVLALGVGFSDFSAGAGHTQTATPAPNAFHDSHFHLTNYIQEGIDVRRYLEIMGTRVGRSTLFGIPLQQQWSYANSGDYAPTYYLFGTDTVAPAGPGPYYAVFEQWTPIWKLLTPETSALVRTGNYERLFDEGRKRVREWEKTQR